MARSVGVIEYNGYSDIVAAADRMVKAADIRLVRRENIGDAQVALIIEGDTNEVERALGAAKQGAPEALTTTLVSNVSSRVISVFNL